MIFKHVKYRQLLEFNVKAREIILLVIFFLSIFIEEVILKREIYYTIVQSIANN